MSALDLTEEQRLQWSRFNELLKEADAIKLSSERGAVNLDKLKNLADKGLEILILVEHLEIAMLDMRLMETLFDVFQLSMKTLHPEQFIFTTSDFAARILKQCGERPTQPHAESGSKIVRKFAETANQMLCYSAPTFETRLGALEVDEPVRVVKQRERRTKDKIEPAKEPERLTRVESKTLEETIVDMERQLERLYLSNNKSPINYLEFVIHPTSFATTVENIFHTTFLVNTNKAHVYLEDSSGLPMVVPHKSEMTREGKSAMVMTLTMAEWKEAVKTLNITEPMLTVNKDSDDSQQPSTSGTRAAGRSASNPQKRKK